MKKILIVEDDLATQKIYLNKLAREGYKVMVSDKGTEAIPMALKNKPDLILLDIMLQDTLNGFEVLELLKKDIKTRNIPVFILTNMGSEDKFTKDMGAAAYFIKANTSLEELLNKIKRVLK